MNEYPRDENVSVVLADDVRAEINGKFSILGFYPGNEVNVKKVGLGINISITFFILIGGNEAGDYRFGFELVDPDKNRFVNATQQLKKMQNRGCAQIVKIPALPVLKAGDWTINLKLDDQLYVRTVKITNNLSYFDN